MIDIDCKFATAASASPLLLWLRVDRSHARLLIISKKLQDVTDYTASPRSFPQASRMSPITRLHHRAGCHRLHGFTTELPTSKQDVTDYTDSPQSKSLQALSQCHAARNIHIQAHVTWHNTFLPTPWSCNGSLLHRLHLLHETVSSAFLHFHCTSDTLTRRTSWFIPHQQQHANVKPHMKSKTCNGLAQGLVTFSLPW